MNGSSRYCRKHITSVRISCTNILFALVVGILRVISLVLKTLSVSNVVLRIGSLIDITGIVKAIEEGRVMGRGILEIVIWEVETGVLADFNE